MLKKTSKDKKHYHMAYIKPNGTGITSKDHGHEHPIITKEITIQGYNEQNQPTETKEAGDIEVVKVDGHTHTLEEIEINIKEEKELSDEEETKLVYALYNQAKKSNDKAFSDALVSEKFYMGDQWAEADKARLKAEDRACITINETKSKLDTLSGYQRQNRTDIAVLPVEGGDVETADIINTRIKNINQINSYDHEETRTFEDQTRVGVGYMMVNIVASDEGIGEVEVTNKYWKKCGFGPHLKFDGKDAEYAYMEDLVSKSKLKEMYPDKADDIETDYEYVEMQSKTGQGRNGGYTGHGRRLKDSCITDIDSTMVDVGKKEYKLVEVMRKIYKKTPVLFNARDNFYFNADGMDKGELTKALKIEDVLMINHVSDSIQITVFASNVLLAKEKSMFSNINLVPFYANKIEEYYWGKIHEVKGAQDELNKRHSQIIDIINKMASYGIGVTSEAFETIKDYNDFVKNRNKPGFVAKFKEGFKDQIHEFQGVKYPSEVVASSQLTSEKINTIMNVYQDKLGGQAGSESGVAIAQKQRLGLIGNEYLFDNFSLSKRRIGMLMVEAIQIVDSPEKLLRIAENQNNNTMSSGEYSTLYPEITLQKKVQIAMGYKLIQPQDAQLILQSEQQGQPIPPQLQEVVDSMQKIADEIHRAKLLAMLDNFELTKYDLVVAESAHSPTTRLSNYVILQDLFRGNPNAPIAELIELMPYLDQKAKDKITKAMSAQAQARAASEKMKYETELKKTLIANEDNLSQQNGTPPALASAR